jgi:hypothetical protein
MLIFAEGGKSENPEKTPRSKGENQQTTQLACDAESGSRTRVTEPELRYLCFLKEDNYDDVCDDDDVLMVMMILMMMMMIISFRVFS